MKCPNCGAEAASSFCPYCGSEMPRQPINITNNYYYTPNTPAQNNTPVPNYNQTTGVCCAQCGSNNISFNRESLPTRGLHKTVALCKNCGNTWVTAQDIMVPSQTGYYPQKSKGTALFLCFFLGFFGAHQFYVGKSGMGFLYLFTVGLFGFGWFIDIFRILGGGFKDSHGIPLK